MVVVCFSAPAPEAPLMMTESVLAPVAGVPVAEKQERKNSPPLPYTSVGPLRTVMSVSPAAMRMSIVRVDDVQSR